MADASLLLDTDVLIEFLRGNTQAREWLLAHGNDIIGIPVLVLMELLQGARDRSEQEQIERQLALLPVQHLQMGDSQLALGWFAAHRLSHGIGILDCLIAAVATRVGVPLYSFNVAHFRVIPGLDVRQPYERAGAALPVV